MKFVPTHTDYKLSPYTGMTRESWLEAATYLLEGIFRHIPSADSPVIVPRKETEITYPHKGGAAGEQMAEIFEGLARSFFIAAPLIHDNPEVNICGYSLRDYYKKQVLCACTPTDKNYVGNYEDLCRINKGDKYSTFQQTVETCALVICLEMSREEIWETYTRKEKDIIADFLLSFAHAETVPQNWRLFNMLDMAFLHKEGYEINKDVMVEHAHAILDYYAGDGWYRDGHSFDYYSVWAFSVYAPIWNKWYGYEKIPYIAQKFEENSNRLMETYADFFDEDGYTNMWGRSSIYRFAATSAFDGNLMLRHSTVDMGRARRIASGSLLQFLTREDFLYEGIPTLGFYGQFSPLVQGYSCAESPFWMGKAFLFLHLPKDHPFWTTVENNGTWEKLGKQEVKVTTLEGPGLCFSNHKANGETILRTGKVLKNAGDEHGMWNYSKLCFNTKYPWEAAPARIIESQQYVLERLYDDVLSKANVTFWQGEKEGVLYRKQFFDYNLQEECTWIPAINLADFIVSYGIMRVDKLRLYRRPVRLTLGAYGFPDNGTEIQTMERENAKAIILKGHDAEGREKQMAMTIFDGWEELQYVNSTGTNPESEKSIVVYAEVTQKTQYGNEPSILISQVITKESLEDFTEEEIFPIKSVTYTDEERRGGYGEIKVTLHSGEIKTIDFEGWEGNLAL